MEETGIFYTVSVKSIEKLFIYLFFDILYDSYSHQEGDRSSINTSSAKSKKRQLLCSHNKCSHGGEDKYMYTIVYPQCQEHSEDKIVPYMIKFSSQGEKLTLTVPIAKRKQLLLLI